MEMNNENIAKQNASQEGINALAAALSLGAIVLPPPAVPAGASAAAAAPAVTPSIVTDQHTSVATALSKILRGNNKDQGWTYPGALSSRVEGEMLLQPDENLRGWDPPPIKEVKIDIQTTNAIITAVNGSDNEINGGSQLDSHVNMNVFGKHCYVISSSGKYANVSAFSDEVGAMLTGLRLWCR
jgi:hypothetical protein